MKRRDFDKLKEITEMFAGDAHQNNPSNLDGLERNVLYNIHRANDISSGWPYLYFYPSLKVSNKSGILIVPRMTVTRIEAEFLIKSGYSYYVKKLGKDKFQLLEWDETGVGPVRRARLALQTGQPPEDSFSLHGKNYKVVITEIKAKRK